MKTEFTAQDELDLLKQFETIKSLPVVENGTRFVSNSWLINDEENPRSIFFTFQTVSPNDDLHAHFNEPINVAVNKELIDGLRENFHQIIAIASKETADKLWNVVYSDELEAFWCFASGGGMSISNGFVVLSVTTEAYNPDAVPGDDAPASASEETLIQTIQRCRAISDADSCELSFSMTVPVGPAEELTISFEFLSCADPMVKATMPKLKRQQFDKSPAFSRLGKELGFLTPYTFSEITSGYMYPTGTGQAEVEIAETDDFVILRHDDSVLKVRFWNAITPKPSVAN